MRSVAYTNHIGTAGHDANAKNTTVASAADLANLEKHNNHNYSQKDIEKMESNINLELKKLNKHYDRNFNQVEYLNYYDNVKSIYKEEFPEALAEYNAKQTRKDRIIKDYFEHISNDKKQEVCVEGIIQFGSKEDWEDKSIEEKMAVEKLYLRTLKRILELKGLHIAGASFHINEDSPHLHWVAVPIRERKEIKNGMRKVIHKSHVFNKKILGDFFQDQLRKEIEPAVEEMFGWNFKEKKTGRNKDLSKNEYINEKLIEEKKTRNHELYLIEEEKKTADAFLYNVLSETEMSRKELTNLNEKCSSKKAELKNLEKSLLETSSELQDKASKSSELEAEIVMKENHIKAVEDDFERQKDDFKTTIAEMAKIKIEFDESKLDDIEYINFFLMIINNVPGAFEQFRDLAEDIYEKYKEDLEYQRKDEIEKIALNMQMEAARMKLPALMIKQKEKSDDLEL